MSGFDADVAVIGLGAMGSTAAWRLAARGVDVVGIERFRPGHDQGSSHGGTRLFRMLCMEHPNLVTMARELMRLWRELEASQGVSLLQLTGGLVLGPAGGKVIAGTRLAAEVAGVELHDIPRDEVAERWPQHVGLGPDDVALFDPMAGVLDPEAGVIAASAAAAAAGVTLLTDTGVKAIELVNGGVVIRLAARGLRVRQVIVTAGPWLGELVPGLRLEVIRTPMTWFEARDAEQAKHFTIEAFPIFIRKFADGSATWGHGSTGEHGVKVGPDDDFSYRRTRADDVDRRISREDTAYISAVVAQTLPGLDPAPSRTTTCMITRSPGMQFQLGRPGGDPSEVRQGGVRLGHRGRPLAT